MIFTRHCHKERPTRFYFPNNLSFSGIQMTTPPSFPVGCATPASWRALLNVTDLGYTFFISVQKQSSLVNCVPCQFIRVGVSGLGVNLPLKQLQRLIYFFKIQSRWFWHSWFQTSHFLNNYFGGIFLKGKSGKGCVDVILSQSSLIKCK